MTISQTARRLAAATTIGLAAIALTGCSLITQALNGGESGVFTLKVGDCLNDSDSAEGDVSTVPVTDCDKPHDSEIFAAVTMDEGDYPGESETATIADEECFDEFEDFIGAPFDGVVYTYSTLYPTQGSWDVGDREILCSALQLDESGEVVQVEGSLEGAAK
jgi:hypothetical protein